MADTSFFPDETLWAFVDGEVDAKTARSILSAERCDDVLADRIRRMREQNAAVVEVFDAQLRPLSPDLVEDIRMATNDLSQRRFGALPSVAAMAASIAVAVGLGAFFTESRLDSRVAALEAKERSQRELVSQLMQQALEQRLSGEAEAASLDVPNFSARITPTQTYKSRSGHWCRSFTETLDFEGEAVFRRGVACRVDGDWRRLETKIEGELAMERL